MRVATYTQAESSRGSSLAVMILALTVVLGTSALHTLMTHFAPQLHTVIALLWLVTYLACFTGLMFSHGINWISWLARYRILLVILLLGTTVSVSWSLDAAVSAERVVHLLGSSIIAIYIGFMVPLLTILRVTAIVLGVIMVASIGAAFVLPALGMQEYEGQVVWSGILNSKNALGFWAACAVLLYITLSDSTNTFFMKLVCYAMALVSMFVLYNSHSATSLLAMIIAGTASLYIYIAFRFQLGFIRMVVLAVLFGGLIGFALSNIDTAELVGRTNDLTGRGEVWRQTWKLIMERPVTGYGYGSIWFPNDATLWIQQSLTDFTWVVYHAHNGFLQVASEIGLPLSCVALLMVAQQLIEIFYCQYERQQVGVLFVLAFVLAFLISNFSEARFLVNRELYWIFFLALPISMLRQINLMTADDPDATGAHSPTGGLWRDKPWLRPVNTGGLLAGAGAGAGIGAAGSISLLEHTDIDLGEVIEGDFDINDLDMSLEGDHTFDTTNSGHDVADMDDTSELDLTDDRAEFAQQARQLQRANDYLDADVDERIDPSAHRAGDAVGKGKYDDMGIGSPDEFGEDRYDIILGDDDTP